MGCVPEKMVKDGLRRSRSMRSMWLHIEDWGAATNATCHLHPISGYHLPTIPHPDIFRMKSQICAFEKYSSEQHI